MGKHLRLALLAVAFAFVSAVAQAAYPERAIRFIVPFPPGGSTDVIARTLKPKLEAALGQPVIIENKPGAGGVTGIDAVAKSPADGYTIGLGAAGALTITPHLQQMPFDPLKDLTPITRVAESPFILAAAPSFGASSLREVVERAKGTSLSIGHGGNGTAMHLTAELFNAAAGIQISMVPYRGTAPVVTDLLGGHVMLGIVDPPPSLAALRAGQIKAIAVTGGQRFSVLPEVPTFEEAGLQGFRATGWFGIVAPAGCSPEVVEKLHAAVAGALRDQEVAGQVRATGMEPTPMTAAEFTAYVRSEFEKWGQAVARAGLKRN